MKKALLIVPLILIGLIGAYLGWNASQPTEPKPSQPPLSGPRSGGIGSGIGITQPSYFTSGGVLPIADGGTATATPGGMSLVWFTGTAITSTTTSPLTLGSIKATTTATSTFAGGISVTGGGGLASSAGLTVSGGSLNQTNTAQNIFLGALTIGAATPLGLLSVSTSTATLLEVDSTGELITGGNIVSVATSTGSGTGFVPVIIGGPANNFNFNITTGSAPSGSNATIATFTMPTACPHATVPVWSDANSNTDALAVVSVVFASSTGPGTFVLKSGATGLAGTTNYIWNFQVGCY